MAGKRSSAEIVIWNGSPQPCRVRGHVQIAATNRDGARDTRVVLNGSIPAVDATMPSSTPAYRDATSFGRYLYAQLAAPQFDATASCIRFSGPAIFRLSIGRLSFRAVNLDEQAMQNKILRGCHGRIVLDNIDEPSTDG